MARLLITIQIFILLVISCDSPFFKTKNGNPFPGTIEKPARKKKKTERPNIMKGVDYVVKVVGISDGDTFTGLTEEKEQVKCRIYGIDAPEKRQPFGNRSKQTLSDLIYLKDVTIKLQNWHYSRAVVMVFTSDGKDVGAEMIKAGMAWHSKIYYDSKEYEQMENQARTARTGLWRDPNPTPPWEFRKGR